MTAADCVVVTTQQQATDDAHVLLRVVHGQPAGAAHASTVSSGLPLLTGPATESWLSPTPVIHFDHGGVHLRGNQQIALGHLSIPEDALRAGTADACRLAFSELGTAVHAAGYPWLQRVWIYLGDIHRGDGDDERYRQFCVGRAQALRERGSGPHDFPAATVIGRPEGGASIHFIAARAAGRPVENPRQTSAFDYPRQFGPQPPSFVRAIVTPWDTLLVSGTAAVVGHDSLHQGDAHAQTVEIRSNLDALLASAGGKWRPERGVVYARHREAADDAGLLALGDAVSVVQGDICRRELLVEAEAIFHRPVAGDGPGSANQG